MRLEQFAFARNYGSFVLISNILMLLPVCASIGHLLHPDWHHVDCFIPVVRMTGHTQVKHGGGIRMRVHLSFTYSQEVTSTVAMWEAPEGHMHKAGLMKQLARSALWAVDRAELVFPIPRIDDSGAVPSLLPRGLKDTWGGQWQDIAGVPSRCLHHGSLPHSPGLQPGVSETIPESAACTPGFIPSSDSGANYSLRYLLAFHLLFLPSFIKTTETFPSSLYFPPL